MNEGPNPTERPSGGLPLTLLTLLLGLEAVAMTALALFLLFELLTQPAASIGGGIAIVVLGFLAALWLVAIVIGVVRRRPWIRGAAMTWQFLQIAVAVGCFQGLFAQPDIGWLLLAPALVCILLLLSPRLTAVLRPE